MGIFTLCVSYLWLMLVHMKVSECLILAFLNCYNAMLHEWNLGNVVLGHRSLPGQNYSLVRSTVGYWDNYHLFTAGNVHSSIMSGPTWHCSPSFFHFFSHFFWKHILLSYDSYLYIYGSYQQIKAYAACLFCLAKIERLLDIRSIVGKRGKTRQKKTQLRLLCNQWTKGVIILLVSGFWLCQTPLFFCSSRNVRTVRIDLENNDMWHKYSYIYIMCLCREPQFGFGIRLLPCAEIYSQDEDNTTLVAFVLLSPEGDPRLLPCKNVLPGLENTPSLTRNAGVSCGSGFGKKCWHRSNGNQGGT